MGSETILQRFDDLGIGKQGDQRAANKPLLVLEVVLVGMRAFATPLTLLRGHARPVYVRLGIFPSPTDRVAAATSVRPALEELAGMSLGYNPPG